MGWYFYKSRSGLWIRCKDPSKKALRKWIIKVMPFWVILAIYSFVGLSLKEGYQPIITVSAAIGIIIIPALICLSGKFWLLQILFINRKSYSLINHSVHIDRRDQRLPCYLLNTEISHESDSDLYRVYLRPSEFLKIEGPSEDWNSLVWESIDAKEASQIVEELCQCGIGDKDFEKQHPIIYRNKKIGFLILGCYILCFIALIFFIMQFIKPDLTNNPDSIKPLLHLIQSVVIFVFFSIIAYSGYKIWFGMLVIKHRQIPPPEMIILFDTKLFQGEKAVKRGRTMVAKSIVIIVLSLIGTIYLHYNMGKVLGIPGNQETITTTRNH